MDNHSFNLKIRPLNIKYKEVFGVIPRIIDYSCTRDEYISALEKAIKEHRRIEEFLISRTSNFIN